MGESNINEEIQKSIGINDNDKGGQGNQTDRFPAPITQETIAGLLCITDTNLHEKLATPTTTPSAYQTIINTTRNTPPAGPLGLLHHEHAHPSPRWYLTNPR